MKGNSVNNKMKATAAYLGVVFVLAGLSKVAEKSAKTKIDEKWPTPEITEA